MVKADNFVTMAGIIDSLGQVPGSPPKNVKKHVLFITPTIEHGLLRNKSYNFNVHIVSPSDEGSPKVFQLMESY